MTAGAALLASEASFNRYIVECKLKRKFVSFAED